MRVPNAVITNGSGSGSRAGVFHEALAEQEIAIAVHHVERDAAFGERVHQRRHAAREAARA